MATNAPKAGRWLATLIVIAAVGGAGWWWWKQRSPSAAASISSWKTNVVSRGDIVQAVTANGAIVPTRTVEVGSQVSGILTEVNVDYNSRVKEGQVLAKIDPATYERAVARAEAQLANSRAALELAQFNAKRATELFASRLISETENEQAVVALHQAEANVKIQVAAVESAKVDLERTTILAPIGGIIITRAVEAGQTVAASFNTPRLFTIANDLTKMQIEAAVSETDIGGVQEGQTVNFLVDAFMNRSFKGKVKQVRFAPVTNQNVVTYTTIVEVDNADLRLRPGMTANATIVTSERRGAIRAPLAAFRFRPPEGVPVLRDPAAAPASPAGGAQASKVEIATNGPWAGAPVPPWATERRRPTDEERTKFEASLTPDQKDAYMKARDRMRAQFRGGGGGPGGGGEGGGNVMMGMNGGGPQRAAPAEGPMTRTAYLYVPTPEVKGGVSLKAVTVKTGITDGATYAEVLEGLKEGDILATGTVSPVAQSATPSNPFGGGPFGGGPPRR